MTTLFKSKEINSLADLQTELAKAASYLYSQSKPENTTFVSTLRLIIVEDTLTDGSKVYDARIIED